MKRFLLALLLAATPAFGADRVISNPDSAGGLKLKVNKGTTAYSDAIVVDGTTGVLTLGPSVGAVANLLNGTLSFNTTETTQAVNGIRRSATNTIAISTNSVDRLTINTTTATFSGDVTAPTLAATSSLVRVTGSAGAVISSIEKTGDGTAELILGNNVGAGGTDKWWRIGVTASASSGFDISTVQDNNGTSPTNIVTITRGGAVSIFPSAVANGLTVTRSGNTSNYVAAFNGTDGTNSSGVLVNISNTTVNRDILTLQGNSSTKFNVNGDGQVYLKNVQHLAIETDSGSGTVTYNPRSTPIGDVLYFNGSGAKTLQTMTAPAVVGVVIYISNNTGSLLTITDSFAGGVNDFTGTPGGTGISLANGATVQFIYFGSRWRFIKAT
jgi:hypothetical protein